MLYKPKDSQYWWTRFQINQERIRESTGTKDKTAAQEYEDSKRAALWRKHKLGISAVSWEQAVINWTRAKSHKRSFRDDLSHIRWLDPLLRGRTLDEIGDDITHSIIERSQTSNATTNRRFALIRAICRFHNVIKKFPMFPEEARIRWITREEAQKLVDALPYPYNDMCLFTLATGLRANNVFRLKWCQVDLDKRIAWISPSESKSKKTIHIPLSPEAIVILRRQDTKGYVFPIDKGHIESKLWKSAIEKAGIEDFRWHDLRHTWASWHIQAGTPVAVLKELGGWHDIKMVMKYAHLGASHLSEYAGNSSLSGFWHRDRKSGAGEGT